MVMKVMKRAGAGRMPSGILAAVLRDRYVRSAPGGHGIARTTMRCAASRYASERNSGPPPHTSAQIG